MSTILRGDENYNTIESVDRISALPDFILSAILSLLPTKNALATSTLSKRWEFMWRTVHTLDFCLDIRGPSITVEQVEDGNKKFIGLVNHVLFHHDAGVLNKFRLVWTPACIPSLATSWIKRAISRKVYEISLTITDFRSGPFDIPISIFSCDSLRSLQSDGWNSLSASSVFCLPRLESLDLEGVTFQSDEALQKIIRGCPKLTNLHIGTNGNDEEFRFVISSTSIRRLELNLGLHKYLKLEASSLEHLKIYSYESVSFVPINVSSLVEANFMINFLDEEFSQSDTCNSVVDAVSALDCAEILTLSSSVMGALCCATLKLSTNFKRLVKLELFVDCCYWSSLQVFIQSSNNLEVLTVYKDLMELNDENDHYHWNWTTPVEVPRCLSTSLKKVVLYGYYGHEDEREMIRYMLQHGSVLEVMHISCDRDEDRNKFELLQEICQFPRKSPACKVKFIEQT